MVADALSRIEMNALCFGEPPVVDFASMAKAQKLDPQIRALQSSPNTSLKIEAVPIACSPHERGTHCVFAIRYVHAQCTIPVLMSNLFCAAFGVAHQALEEVEPSGRRYSDPGYLVKIIMYSGTYYVLGQETVSLLEKIVTSEIRTPL